MSLWALEPFSLRAYGEFLFSNFGSALDLGMDPVSMTLVINGRPGNKRFLRVVQAQIILILKLHDRKESDPTCCM